MISCAVCGAQVIESHFGAMVCRACSAFFRRYVLSKNKTILCEKNENCVINRNIKKMCRFCRMVKCLQVGMIPTRINEPIISKSTDKILELLNNYTRFQEERFIVHGPSVEKINFLTASTIMEADYRLARNHIERSSKEFVKIPKKNQNALFDHYYTGCIVAEGLYFVVNSGRTDRFCGQTGRQTLPIEQYFLGEHKNTILTDTQINDIFQPFWRRGLIELVNPLIELKLDLFEYTSLFVLMLFDGSSKGIDEECVEICYQIRNIIFREISSYHKEIDHPRPFDRMADIMHALTLMEKGKQMLADQFTLCCLHKLDHNEQICLIFKETLQ